MSAKHLDRYVAEFSGRHNRRPLDTEDMMAESVRGMVRDAMSPEPRVRERMGIWREIARVLMDDDHATVQRRIKMAYAMFPTWRRSLRWRVSPSVMEELRRQDDAYWADKMRWTPRYDGDPTLLGTPIVVDPEMMGHRISLEVEGSQLDPEVDQETSSDRASINIIVTMAYRRWPHVHFAASEHESSMGPYWQVRISHSHWTVRVGLPPISYGSDMSMWADTIIDGVRELHDAMAQGLLSDNPIL